MPKVRSRSKKSIAACVSTPGQHGARARDWLRGLSDWACATLSEEIFLAEKNISCGKKYFLRKKYISCREKFISCGKIYFLRKKYISCGEKYFLRKKIFLAEKYISCGEKLISCGKKYVSCGEKYISCGEKYFLRKKKISCGKIFLYHVTNKLPYDIHITV